MQTSRQPFSAKSFVAALFGLVLFLGGLFSIFTIYQNEIWRLDTRAWEETACTVTDCKAEKEAVGAWINVSYTYKFLGSEYVSHVYSYDEAPPLSKVEAACRQYQAEPVTVCFVNPIEPSESVLAHAGLGIFFTILIPIPFILFGLFIIVKALFPPRIPVSAIEIPEGGVILNAKEGRIGKVIFTFIFAVIWNGVVSFFLFQCLAEWLSGDGDMGLTLFILLFGAIGIFVAGLCFYYLLALFNPEPQLILPSPEVGLGETVNGFWRIRGDFRKIKGLTIVLIGQEETTYRRGTNTETDIDEFYSKVIVNVPESKMGPMGEFSFNIPGNYSPSFDAGNNAIVWYLRVSGDIPKWPDISDEFSIYVVG